MNLKNQIKDQLLILLGQKQFRFLLPIIFKNRIKNAQTKINNFNFNLDPKIYKHKLVVIYRISPHPNSKTPIFSKNKFQLVKFCLDSFIKAFAWKKPFIIFLLDSCPPKYKQLIKKYKNISLQIIKLDRFNNLGTFHLQLTVAQKLKAKQLVYFAEDDYFYLPQAGTELIKGLAKFPFVSLYDHPDNYQKINQSLKSGWHLAQSTCLTFGAQIKTLQKYIDIFYKYPFSYPIWQELWDQKIKLVRHIPSLSTHMQKFKLAKNINWFKIWQI